MTAKDLIRSTLDGSAMILTKYLEDLDDADLAFVPIDGMNPIAWQVGHLIASERRMIEGIKPGASPPLPEGFEALHARDEKGRQAGSKPFLSKAEYLELFKAQRAATVQALDAASDEDLDAPAPEKMRQMWPTVGTIFNLTGTHVLMHVGQFVAVRRARRKPIAI